MLRHTAATNWVRAGVHLDVVQRLLGHASLASNTVYLHARNDQKRRAVEAVAASASLVVGSPALGLVAGDGDARHTRHRPATSR